MKYSILNRFTPLMQEFEPQTSSGGGADTLEPDDGLSLSERFAKSGFASQADPDSSKTPETPKSAETPPATPSGTPPGTPPATPQGGDDEEFPEIGSGTKPPVAAAADDFDAEAEKREKAIEFKDDKAGDHWKWLKQQAKESRQKALELEQKLASSTVPPEVEQKVKQLETEVEGLRARNLELTQVSDQTAIRQTQEYQDAVTAPLNSIGEVIGQIAEAKGVDPKMLEDALLETNPAIQDEMLDALTAKLGPRLANRLATLADDTKRIFSIRDKMLAEAGKKLEESKLQQAQRAQAEATRKAAVFQQSVRSSFETYASRVPGYTDSNGKLTDVGQAAAAAAAALDVNALPPEDLAYMAFCMKALPELRRSYRKMEQDMAILRGGQASSQGIGGGSPPLPESGSAPDNEFDDGATLAERMRGKNFSFTPPA